ncbi:hypothetical protein [Microbacterium sp. BR1]|uniref:hypothetical protein n=1 Tax=Microbacterium sp. BR1 TaxID=1070896 RepID=UPI0012FE6ED5|nr:hypothetical protein [Microbacterium sp. BR1]
MRNIRNRGLHALAGVVLLTGLVACAPSPATEKPGELDSSSQQQDYEEWQLAWEKCVGDQGVDLSQFMVKAGEAGDEGSAPPPKPTEADRVAMEKAMEFCDEELGQAPTRDDLPSSEEMNEMGLLLAACMREAGYDFPDPEIGPGGTVAGQVLGRGVSVIV